MHTRPFDVQNIGPRERKKRLQFGCVLLGVGIALAACLLLLQVHRGWRIALFFPLAISAMGFLQAAEKT